MHLLSLAAQTVLDAGPAGHIRAAAAAGFRFVGPRLKPLLPTDLRIVGDPRREGEVLRALAETGIAVLEVGVFPITADLDGAAFAPEFAFCRRIGARFIVCPAEDSNAERQGETLARVCDLAARNDLGVLIEFNPRRACATLPQALALVAAAARPNAGLLIDALHLSRSGGHPRDLAAVDPTLLRLVHLCDATAFAPGPRTFEDMRREANNERLYPGEGQLWLDELLDALPKDIPVSIEAPSRKYAHLPAVERARLAREATERLIARHV